MTPEGSPRPESGDSSFHGLERRIARRLTEHLPGAEAQSLMAPRPRTGWVAGRVPSDCRRGAGLLLLYPGRHGEPYLVLTVRDSRLPQHAGQVSLPGGAVEPGETIAAAALREAREEVGAVPDRLRVLGELSPLHIPVSGFVLHPVVAVTDHGAELSPEDGEVARILEVPFRDLEDPARLAVETRTHEGERFRVPFFRVEGEKVWGATAMILAELLSLIGRPPAAPF